MNNIFDTSIECAKKLDAEDKLSAFRDRFEIPTNDQGDEEIYFVGNSLGLMPKKSVEDVNEELSKWGKHGVKGHGAEGGEIEGPWVTFHEPLTKLMAKLVGGKVDEVTIMNTLTVNIHFLLISFYNPIKKRKKIIIEENAFPSDYFAVESQVKQRNLDPSEVIVKVPVDENGILDVETVIKTIESVGDELALVFLPGVQYYSGQVLPIEQIIKVSHKVGALVGIQLAHGVGNIELELSNWNVDFATWCTYKYLNSGPGSIAACYINEKHVNRKDIQRLHGWWGNSLETRFEMENQFDEKNTADVWQVSNPPILSMAPIKAAMDLIIEAGGMKALRKKSINMSMYFDYLIEENLYDDIQIITPQDTDSRGCQLSLKVVNSKLTGRGVFNSLLSSGVACDWRYPDVIRVAPVPMYNSYLEIYNFVEILRKIINE